jgi:hypothetical protein
MINVDGLLSHSQSAQQMIRAHPKRQIQTGPQSEHGVQRRETDACSHWMVHIGVELGIDHVGKEEVFTKALWLAVPQVFKQTFRNLFMQVWGWFCVVEKALGVAFLTEAAKDIVNPMVIDSDLLI